MAGGRLFLSYSIANHDLLDQGRLLRFLPFSSDFIRFPFFNLIHQILNFLLDLARMPLDEQDPEPNTPLAISHIKQLP